MFCLLLCGCGSTYQLYTGELPKEYVAEVHNSGEVQILTVDGNKEMNGRMFGHFDETFGYSCSLKMLPGEHIFTLFYVSNWDSTFKGDTEVSLKVVLAAGHKYIIKSKIERTSTGHFYVWDETESKQLQTDNANVFVVKQIEIQPTTTYQGEGQGGSLWNDVQYMNWLNQTYGPKR